MRKLREFLKGLSEHYMLIFIVIVIFTSIEKCQSNDRLLKKIDKAEVLLLENVKAEEYLRGYSDGLLSSPKNIWRK